MTKLDGPERFIVKSSNKGTKTSVESFTPLSWAGKTFKKSQEEKLGQIKGLKIESSKGTTKIDLAKLGKTAIPKLDGRYVSSRKGTELLKL